MKPKLFSLILMIVLGWLPVFCEESEGGDYEAEGDEFIVRREDPDPNRPNSIDHDYIICRINNGYLSIGLPKGVLSASVSICNETKGWIGFITRENNSVMLPFSSGVYSIEIQTNDGRQYRGIVSI